MPRNEDIVSRMAALRAALAAHDEEQANIVFLSLQAIAVAEGLTLLVVGGHVVGIWPAAGRPTAPALPWVRLVDVAVAIDHDGRHRVIKDDHWSFQG